MGVEVLDEVVLEELRSIVGEDWVVVGGDEVDGYLYDETLTAVRPRASRDVIVVKPGSAEEVSEILVLANRYEVPVFPRGGGTGLVGGCVPTVGGIVVCLERMNGVTVDEENLMAEAEAGATLADLIRAAEKAGLFFPLHPGDEGAQIGGLIACNAGGVRAVKTGVMRNYVKGVEVVLPTGEKMILGGKILKDNVGYDLMQLIIGSEGTLGIITKAWIRLSPKPSAFATIIIPFDGRRKALATAPRILQEGVLPLAMEYVERRLVDKAARELNMVWPCRSGEYQLMVILAESSEEALLAECEKILSLCEEDGALEPLLAESRREQEEILRIRSELYPVLKRDMVDTLDVTVPPSMMAQLIEEIEGIGRRHGIEIPVIGHAGDGNLHVVILEKDGWSMKDYERVEDEIYEKTVELGGVITGEHGIGYVKKRFLAKYVDPRILKLMKSLKSIFDPKNILNPDKIFP
ncbi:MAG: FAD-binding oxidoreductase [Thaumarchaeota archaeon]|nr:FAD-binding oxidoreductase [Nitrososphaerota archaeon]